MDTGIGRLRWPRSVELSLQPHIKFYERINLPPFVKTIDRRSSVRIWFLCGYDFMEEQGFGRVHGCGSRLGVGPASRARGGHGESTEANKIQRCPPCQRIELGPGDIFTLSSPPQIWSRFFFCFSACGCHEMWWFNFVRCFVRGLMRCDEDLCGFN